MTDLPPQPDPDALPPYPEVNPPATPEEAPQTSPTPQEEETGRPHDEPAPGRTISPPGD